MHVTHLWVADFRNYISTDVSLEPGVTFLVGPNGQGKTNLVEAIGYLATLRSHRVASDGPLVRFGADHSVIRAAVSKRGRSTTVEVDIIPGRANKAGINRTQVSRPRDILGTVRTVLFAPEDLSIIKGDPSGRRDFLDELLVARQPKWASVQGDYARALKQRNALLKKAVPPGGGGKKTSYPKDPYFESTLSIWDDQLAGLGGRLMYARLRLLHDLSPRLKDAYFSVSEDGTENFFARATYRTSLIPEHSLKVSSLINSNETPDVEDLQQALFESLQGSHQAEFARGVTLFGPHRDEVDLSLGEMPVKGYASHGETWSFALALKLASYHLLRHDLGEDPVLILDDVFAELDARRRARLAELIEDAEQVLITAAVEEDIPPLLQGKRLNIFAGNVRDE
ncbi:DNA replication/repair protein RecF [Dermatophilus congolensis]|uniref:DNA replication/repair protein RecF n=1 Tax=Dermatophilus congolensis TaxID=1863 RepID=UPI001AAF0422|nr:DNA replication/repair protein RecF [Dermatophilus congolensis]MBO3143878.1 DNA replication/repair protein RecF [Dermatophilus congolensis]MBO3152869.1 DNA replication/repair protein RecF [Dermatophilus congolensis]MBO3160121.1 DNA replication/repair protein RecF [Dermatophilus congolensis]MBO3164154.1 DNA replication/repair protein RecF [Dermatophilus congolensis]MBO3177700.1 DNA replication/repair protein RecF [Dermatophilus congolensis]